MYANNENKLLRATTGGGGIQSFTFKITSCKSPTLNEAPPVGGGFEVLIRSNQ